LVTALILATEASYDYCKRHNENPAQPKLRTLGLAIYEQVSVYSDEYAVCSCYTSAYAKIPSSFCILDNGVHGALDTITGPNSPNTEQLYSIYY
jgi:hypothetical protein